MSANAAILNFTDTGLNHIRNAILAEQALGFRLAVKKTGCSGYAYVTTVVKDHNPDDLQFQVADITVFVDQKSIPLVEGTTIDFVDQGLGQTKLLFNNPNAANLCGCGESFNLLED